MTEVQVLHRWSGLASFFVGMECTRLQPLLQGDSGGPMTVEDDTTKQHSLVGVTSWGDGCAKVSIIFFSITITEVLSAI